MYVEPETHNPNFSYFGVIEMDKFDQTAIKMLPAVKGASRNIFCLKFGIN